MKRDSKCCINCKFCDNKCPMKEISKKYNIDFETEVVREFVDNFER